MYILRRIAKFVSSQYTGQTRPLNVSFPSFCIIRIRFTT